MPIQLPEKPRKRGSILSLIILALVLTGIYFYQNPGGQETVTEVTLSAFRQEVTQGLIESVQIEGNRLSIKRTDGTLEYTTKESTQSLNDVLNGVPREKKDALSVQVIDSSESQFWTDLLIQVLPLMLLIGFLLFMMRQAQSSNNQALSFGKSKPHTDDKTKPKTTFADVAGVHEVKEELKEVVDFLENGTKYTAVGAKIPKGVLLIGPPGTGKTLLARAVAGEANVPFFSIVGSEFVEMFVGVGAARVRDLFKKAKRNAPCIIFIDEIDAVGRQRGAGLGGGHDEREQTLNQILAEMDGFEQGTNVIVIASTNRPDVLDPALLRPGRFDRRIVVDRPDIKERVEILQVHARGKPMAKNVDLESVAKQTAGFSGADLQNLLNEAAILTAKLNKKKITMAEVEQSIEKVSLGPERKNRMLSKKEKEITAYHETGHALIGQLLTHCDPVHKLSIISRGMALGVTWFVPQEDKHLITKSKFEDEICSLMGGYVAEKMVFGEVTTGASNDLERATKMARSMCTEYGMSENVGPIIYGEKSHEVFLGRDFGHAKNYSEEVAAKIDAEVKQILHAQFERATQLLTKNRKKLVEIAKILMEKETLSREDFIAFFPGMKDKLDENSKSGTIMKTTGLSAMQQQNRNYYFLSL